MASPYGGRIILASDGLCSYKALFQFPVIPKPRLVLPWEKTDAQRKYIELTNEATFKWANWDPPKVIQVSHPLQYQSSLRRTRTGHLHPYYRSEIMAL